MWQPFSSRPRSTPRRARSSRSVQVRHASVEQLEARALLAVNPLGSIPQLHSNPGVFDALYLDFDGHFEAVWGTHNNLTTPAYDVDGDASTFSDSELANIAAVWAAVAEDYAPFNIDVTTVQPSVVAPGTPIASANGVALRVAIGGTSDVLGSPGSAGYSYINSYTSSIANVAYVFPTVATGNVPTTVATFASHEAGHAFGLQHQSTYDANEVQLTEYNLGDMKTWAPLMGTILSSSQTTIWYNGPSSLGATVYQDDMAVLSRAVNTFGYRTDDHGNTSGNATPLSVVGATWSDAGFIGTNTDIDTFSFTISAGDTYRIAVDVAAIGPNLDAVLELRNSGGTLIEFAAPAGTLGAEIVRNLTPGGYSLAVKSTSVYGWIGQYTVDIDRPPAGITVTPASRLMTTGEDGRSTSFTVVLDAQPSASVLVPVSSSNPAEGATSITELIFTPVNWNVPQVVTVTGQADGVVDNDVAYSVIVGAASSTDAEYGNLEPADVELVNVDTDAAGFLYRVDGVSDVVERRSLSGLQPQSLVDLKQAFGSTLNYSPRGIAVDTAGAKLYWTDYTTHGVHRANLDGSGAETVVSATTGSPTGIALDAVAGKMYWADPTVHKIRRANLDGSLIQDLVTDPSGSATGIALDTAAGKMYWTDGILDSVRRANLDGTNVEVLWTGTTASALLGISLDVTSGKMYWSDSGEDFIRRANLDGTNVEVVVDATTFADSTNVYGLTLDVPVGKLYWTDSLTQTLYRANLDGSVIVPLVGVSSFGLAIAHPGPGVTVTHSTGLTTTEAGGSDTFQVSLDTRPTANVTIPVGSGDTTEGTVSTASLTFTPANWNIPQTVTITGVDDTLVDGNIAYTVVLGATTSTDPAYNGLDPVDAFVTNSDNDTPITKFYVVNDGSPDRTYEYTASGTAIENYSINSGNTAPRGAASTAAGDKLWVVDANKKVYVYNTAGGLLGSWTAGTLASNATVEGLATNGTDVWIVDAKSDKVFHYATAASRTSGSQNAASSFSLNSGNSNPKDIVTDGTSLWVVNDATIDKVFKYTLSGSLLGSWTITGGGSSPTGITLDPSSGGNLWVVDSGTDRVYQFDNAQSRTSGSQSPSTSFALAAGNTNPQGIADPPVDSLLTPPSPRRHPRFAPRSSPFEPTTKRVPTTQPLVLPALELDQDRFSFADGSTPAGPRALRSRFTASLVRRACSLT